MESRAVRSFEADVKHGTSNSELRGPGVEEEEEEEEEEGAYIARTGAGAQDADLGNPAIGLIESR